MSEMGKSVGRNVNVKDFFDDPELEKLHEDRLAMLKQEAERRAEMQQKGHGSYEEVQEGEFLEVVTKTTRVVAHFYHRDFERCKVMDKHLSILAPMYFDTRFIKISAPVRAILLSMTFFVTSTVINCAFSQYSSHNIHLFASQDAPFFVEKLQVRMLPCVICFFDGVAGDRLVGFDDLGKKDDFQTSVLEDALLRMMAISKPVPQHDERYGGMVSLMPLPKQ